MKKDSKYNAKLDAIKQEQSIQLRIIQIYILKKKNTNLIKK